MEILWIRHAEPERIESGSGVPADPALTAAGRAQAERLAAWLAGEQIDVVYASPQRRARETAAPIAAAHGLDGWSNPASSSSTCTPTTTSRSRRSAAPTPRSGRR
ncbi:MAG: histidine phosphatase family protein [Actinomycetota bacterium]